MLRRISLIVVVGLLSVVILVACGDDDDDETPTATRAPATNAPALSPTTGAGTPAAGSPIAGSPVASGSPAANGAGTPVASPDTSTPVALVATPETSAEATPGASATEAAVVPVLTVDLLDIRFAPEEITIPANTDVTITLVNEGVTNHTFDIGALNIHSGTVKSGESTTVTINAAPGEYRYECEIPGHKQAGMVGTLIVQ
jgi:plastocyanin